eukprot:c2687_g1_i1 orf=3-332(-)
MCVFTVLGSMAASTLPSLSLDPAVVMRPHQCLDTQAKLSIVYGSSSAADTKTEKRIGYGTSQSLQSAQVFDVHKRTHMHFKVGSSPEVLDLLKNSDKDFIASLLQENISP